MGLVEKLKDALVPQTREGVVYRCTECRTEFDTARERCPECGSTAVKEEGAFEMRPSE